jgi:hypothetical protein
MDRELGAANQGIKKMSFKDLTARAEAAMTPKPAEVTKVAAKEKEPEANGKGMAPEAKTS